MTRAPRSALLLAGGLGVVSALFGLALVAVMFVPVPVADLTQMISQIIAQGGWRGMGIGPLIEHHNEHRLILTRLAVLVDLSFLDGRQSLLIALILGSAVVNAVALTALVRAIGARGPLIWGLAAVPFGIVLSPVQHENLLNGFQVQFIQVWTFAILAFAALAAAPATGEGRERLYRLLALTLAVQAALLSTYSMKNGLITWPMLVLLAAWLGMSWRCVVGLAAIGGLVILGEVVGFRLNPGHSDPIQSLGKPLEVGLYLFRYLSSGVEQIGKTGQTILGGLGVVASVALATESLFRRSRYTAWHGALLSVAGFIIASGFVTALGRIEFGVEQANESRYTTPSLLFLFVVCVLVLDRAVGGLRSADGWRPSPAAIGAAVIAVLLLVPGMVSTAKDWRDHLAERDERRQAAAIYLAAGPAPDLMRKLYPHTNAVSDAVLRYFLENGDGPYADLEDLIPAVPELGAEFAMPAARCAGAIDSVRANPVDGIRVSGWIAWPKDRDVEPPEPDDDQPEMVLVTDRAGRLLAWGPNLGRADRALRELLDTGGARRFVAAGPMGAEQAVGTPGPLRVIGASEPDDEGTWERMCVLTELQPPAPRFLLAPPANSESLPGAWQALTGGLDELAPADGPAAEAISYQLRPEPGQGVTVDFPLGVGDAPVTVFLPLRILGAYPRSVRVEIRVAGVPGPVAIEEIGRPAANDRIGDGWRWLAFRAIETAGGEASIRVTMPGQLPGHAVRIGVPLTVR